MAHDNLDGLENRSSAPSPAQLAKQIEQTNKVAQEVSGGDAKHIQEAVTAAVTAAIASLAPLLKAQAISPEQIAAIIEQSKIPYVDPNKMKREQREGEMQRLHEADLRAAAERRKVNCTHMNKDKNAISLVHNYPDRQVRGVCMLCNDLIHPREWRIAPPDPKTGRGRKGLIDPKVTPDAERLDPRTGEPSEYKQGDARWTFSAYMVPQHKDYPRVIALEATSD
jgi:hypothetical protein